MPRSIVDILKLRGLVGLFLILIFNQMVKYRSRLDSVFSALSDPTRRAIIESIGGGELTVNEIAAPFRISLPAISRHLRVLERAGLIDTRKDGRTNRVRVRPKALDEASTWIAGYEQFWQRQFASLDQYLAANPSPQETDQ